eukprot:COSAG02_NODE_1312_length_13319_cov_5.355371_6_plen_1028_part_01
MERLCMQCAGGEGPSAAEPCGALCCGRVTSGVLAWLLGSLFLIAAAANYSRADSNRFLYDTCGVTRSGEGDDYYYDAAEVEGEPWSSRSWCTCDDVMPLTSADAGYGYGEWDTSTCMVQYGTEHVQACCEDAYNGAALLTFFGVALSFFATILISGGWLPVCGVLCDCREAFATCNRVVTDEPKPCCWRDCTMIWVTPVWLLTIVMLPLHAVKTEGFDGESNSQWLTFTLLINGVFMVLTAVFTCKPCDPPGHDAASRRARLTDKLLNQCVCAGIGVFCLGLFFALLAFTTTEEQDFSMPCCYCVRDGQADLELLRKDPTGYCECRLTDDGTLVQDWMLDDYENSIDPSLARGGSVSDGGDDMYDNGNYLSTSRCSSGGLAPYTTGMVVVDSDCFGPHGQYRMDLRETMMVVVAKPGTPPLDGTASMPWDFTVSGNLGADGSGSVDAYQDNIPPQSGLKAFAKTVCSREDPSITHLIVVENDPALLHSWSDNTDSDLDQVHRISSTSGLVYIMAAKEYTGQCPTREDVERLFDSVVAMCTEHAGVVPGANMLAQGCGWRSWGESSGEAALVRLEESWSSGHRIRWDLDKLSPPPPPAPLKHCATPGVFYRFSHASSAPGAIGDYYYHVSNVYSGGRNGGYLGQHEWHAASGERLMKTSQCGEEVWVIAKPASSSSRYSEDVAVDTDCWSRVGTDYETPPEVGWNCVSPEQRLCEQFDHFASSWPQLESGLRLRTSSFCVGDDMNRTTSQCPGGDQSEALSDVSGAMDGWENCESAAAFLALSTFGPCGGQTTLANLLAAYLAAAQDTAEIPLSMQEAGLEPLATFGDVCCETCPPPALSPHGTYEPARPSPPPMAAHQPWQQQHNSPQGIHPNSCPGGGNGGRDSDGRVFFSSASTFLSLLCINVSFFLVGNFQGCCCSRLCGSNAVQTQGKCSMVAATVGAWILLAVVDFFGFFALIIPPPPEVVYTLCVMLPLVGILLMFNAHHCSLQAPTQTVQAVVTTSVMDFELGTLASSPTVVPATVVDGAV